MTDWLAGLAAWLHPPLQLLKKFGESTRVDIVVSERAPLPCCIIKLLGLWVNRCSVAVPAAPTSAALALPVQWAALRWTLQEALPTPFGLVRSGVAPDHADTKVRAGRAVQSSTEQKVALAGGTAAQSAVASRCPAAAATLPAAVPHLHCCTGVPPPCCTAQCYCTTVLLYCPLCCRM